MSQITKQLALRLPLDLHGKVVAAANENNRSGHAEMLHRLEESFEVQPVVAEEVVAQIFSTVATEVLTKVITGCFTKLEERVAQILETPPLYSITPADDLSAEEFEALRDQLKAEGQYARLSDLYQRHFQRFDSSGRPGAASPTGRLSESQPELQDLPAVSGINTLPAAILRQGYRYVYQGDPAELVSKPFHTGGYTGLPDGEWPQILEKGERVITAEEAAKLGAVRTADGLTVAGVTFGPDSVITENARPLLSQSWVITGSLETMTRDRAREIIIELGGIVAGKVDRTTDALLWGPGAGSKKARGEQLGVQQYTERQFIQLIRSHGVDMPLPKESEWIENTGAEPAGLTDKSVIDFRLSNGNEVFGHHYMQGSSKGRDIWSIRPDRKVICTHWRLAATIPDQAFAVEPPKENEWIENLGRMPIDLRPGQMIETQTRPFGIVARRAVGDIPLAWWVAHIGQTPHISHWRLAE